MNISPIILDRQAGLAILLSGVCLGLSMPPHGLYPLAWIGLTPLLVRWQNRQSPQKAYLEAASAFLVLYVLAGSWSLNHPMLESALAAFGALLLFPLVHALPFALATHIRIQRGALTGFAALIAFSLTIEYLMLQGPIALPWFLLGHTQAEALTFNQFVDITGVLGLSLWIWLLNGLMVLLLTRRKHLQLILPAVLLSAALIVPYLYSEQRLESFASATEHRRIATIQPALTPQQWADGLSQNRLTQLMELSDSLLSSERPSPELIVWPETALPHPDEREHPGDLYDKLQQWTSQRGLPLLTGSVTKPATAPDPSVVPPREIDHPHAYLNSALLVEGTRPIGQYDKQQLIPFAEGVPLAERWAWMASLAIEGGGVPGYLSGRRAGVMSTRDSLRFGVQICFESVFGRLNRPSVQRGAQFLIVLAQNGWWGRSAGPYQHFAFTRLRAIETRRAVVMASASGASGLIGADGAIRTQTTWMEPLGKRFNVPVHTANTWYVRLGDWPGIAAVILSVLLGLSSIRFKWWG